ncbi:MAG: sodium-dependent bicarbonate transport family permease [Algoriphagus sp.]|uniref:sodium-dependent bicarbonate transport family permease n=1 Tax=Algoriphagus sp. TaxID=1872435 RepID=UPI00271720C1|nr:sodium-dependent bicarbonate transport family permease [Algoriphagus sp.]MDO8965954.1 sodium-dependent bicarbonate transport family permease [Algoriphagus sp.]MDP2041477.1 sodium-dependent bicarbonate transport family permease [Algoriphagus sp.]MDP3198480.1 sodium-dependent bicarbonate transport family permease [Algoriphagus sp.]MDP3472508.1 sodium-dependent bicarbonate transport family permease [Algoriphagus sp.]
MDFQILINNLTNPSLLFFILGILAVKLKSDLEIPGTSAKFIALYLMLSIGFKGGQELSHSDFSSEIVYALIFGVILSATVPFYTFFLLKKRLGVANASAISAAYGSISAVTFVAAVAFLDMQGVTFGGHMVAVMALMEAPAIISAVILLQKYSEKKEKGGIRKIVFHAFTNGSVLLILGSLVIGLIADEKQAEGIKPFVTDIFKGFLAVFLLDMGINSGRKLKAFFKYGYFSTVFAILMPLVNGSMVAFLTHWIAPEAGDRLIFAILAASASYIAVPAAMKLANPKADEGLYVPMALAITFPFNLTFGMPIYWMIIQLF